MNRNVSIHVIRRLPRYLSNLDELVESGVMRISSAELGRRMKLTSSQIRQDFACFGEFGQQGYGYPVAQLREEIAAILGMNRSHTAVIVGVGNLGRALLKNFAFSDYGFQLLAGFDVLPELRGCSINGVPIYDISDFRDFSRAAHIDTVVLTVPKRIAADLAKELVDMGITSFWNFTNVELRLPEDQVIVENIHFSDSLLALSYRIANREETKNESEAAT